MVTEIRALILVNWRVYLYDVQLCYNDQRCHYRVQSCTCVASVPSYADFYSQAVVVILEYQLETLRYKEQMKTTASRSMI